MLDKIRDVNSVIYVYMFLIRLDVNYIGFVIYFFILILFWYLLNLIVKKV